MPPKDRSLGAFPFRRLRSWCLGDRMWWCGGPCWTVAALQRLRVTCGRAVPWGPQGTVLCAVASTLQDLKIGPGLCTPEAPGPADTTAQLGAGGP